MSVLRQGCKFQAWQSCVGRAGQAKIFKLTERAVPAQGLPTRAIRKIQKKIKPEKLNQNLKCETFFNTLFFDTKAQPKNFNRKFQFSKLKFVLKDLNIKNTIRFKKHLCNTNFRKKYNFFLKLSLLRCYKILSIKVFKHYFKPP